MLLRNKVVVLIMASRLFGYRGIQKQIEKKLLQFSYLPSKYFEALYIEYSTKIPCHTLEILEMEEKNVRNLLLKLMQDGQVDTKIEIEKFQLFQRINEVLSKCKEVRLLLSEYAEQIVEENYKRLLKLLKKISETAKIMHEDVEALYDDYELAIEKAVVLKEGCEKLLGELYEFKFCDVEGKCEYSFEDPEVLIGNSLRDSLQEMSYVAEKVVHIVTTFSYKYNTKRPREKKSEKKQKEKKAKKEGKARKKKT